MRLAPFLLDEWLSANFSADPPIEFDLGSSTGPVWTLRELLALEDEDAQERLLNTALSYTHPAGSEELRILEVCYRHIPVQPFTEPPGAESASKPRARR